MFNQEFKEIALILLIDKKTLRGFNSNSMKYCAKYIVVKVIKKYMELTPLNAWSYMLIQESLAILDHTCMKTEL